MGIKLAALTRSAMADAAVDYIDIGTSAGTIKLYTGTQPATADTALSGNTLLATFTLNDPAFGSASSGVATLSGTPLTTTGVADGTCTFFRAEAQGTGAAKCFDGNVGATGSGASLELNTTTISTGVSVEITSGTFTMPAS